MKTREPVGAGWRRCIPDDTTLLHSRDAADAFAAGGVEAIVTVMSLKEQTVHQTINVDNQDPECDLDVTPNNGKNRELNAAMSNAFGFGGTNASVIFQKV